MSNPDYERYLVSPEWEAVKFAKRDRYWCVGCKQRYRLELHHMSYPASIWETVSAQCCWLCDRCHETLHRAPVRYIGMANTEYWTWRVIQAQLNAEDGMSGIAALLKNSRVVRDLRLKA